MSDMTRHCPKIVFVSLCGFTNNLISYYFYVARSVNDKDAKSFSKLPKYVIESIAIMRRIQKGRDTIIKFKTYILFVVCPHL